MIKNEELQIIVLRHKKNLLREYFRRFFVLPFFDEYFDRNVPPLQGGEIRLRYTILPLSHPPERSGIRDEPRRNIPIFNS